MGPVRRRALPVLLLLLVASCAPAGPDADRVLSATGAGAEVAPPLPPSTTAPPPATAHPESVAIGSIKIDFGNGHSVTSTAQAPSWRCGSAQDAGDGRWYVYPAAGTFRITATATFVTCIGLPGAWIGPDISRPAGYEGPWFPNPEQALTAGIDLLQRPDRPPRPVGPPPGA